MDSPTSYSLTLLFSLTISSLISRCVNAQTVVPAYYVIGDSLMDVGNNNYLLTVLRADFPHNGIDFPGGKATGRFTNGKNAADFFAELLGLTSPPPYLAVHLSPKATDVFLQGVNFASGGAGVLSITNKNLCLSLSKQIHYLGIVHDAIAKVLGEEGAQAHLANSIFAMNIGSNDIFNYFRLSSKPAAKKYVDSMISSLQEQIKRMYKLGARKLMFIGLGPVGCCPYQRNERGECNETANHLADLYNHAASSLLREMIVTLPNLTYSFFNTSLVVLDLIQHPKQYGFGEVKVACCREARDASVPCTPLASYCSNRKRYVFWDFAHPTEATIQYTAGIVVDGSPPYVYPMNMRGLSVK